MIIRILSVAQITLLETLWRKHVYVLLLLIAAMYFFFGRFDFFNMGKEASLLRLIPLVSLSIFGVVVSILAAARQVPEEIERRTIQPLLAKPLRRLEFLIGKFAGVFTSVGGSLLLLAGVFHLLLAERGVVINRLYWQAVVLLILQMGVLIAIVIALSTFTSHAATLVLSFLLYYLLGKAGSTLEDMLYSETLPASMTWFYKGLLWVMPRLDLFNISKAVVHDLPPQSWTIVLPFFGYAVLCIAAILLLGSAMFSRKDI